MKKWQTYQDWVPLTGQHLAQSSLSLPLKEMLQITEDEDWDWRFIFNCHEGLLICSAETSINILQITVSRLILKLSYGNSLFWFWFVDREDTGPFIAGSYLPCMIYLQQWICFLYKQLFFLWTQQDKQPCHSCILKNVVCQSKCLTWYIRTLSNIFLMTYKCYDWLIPTLIPVTQYFLCVDVTLTTTLRHPLMSFAFTFASLRDCLD